MNLSIFAKRAFLNTSPNKDFVYTGKPVSHGHLQRVSSMIRGDQIAEHIGARFNPTENYQEDICIYVKPNVRKGDDFVFEGKKNYIDIIDGHNLGQLALKHPEVGIITCSKHDEAIMKSVLPNEVVNIPQHHANFERRTRYPRPIKRVGVIGTKGAFPFLPKGLRGELEKRGLELIEYSKFLVRQDIVDFYLNIDLQVVWRPYKKILSNPLKIVNGASFGVPTIALDELAFKELDGHYLGVNNFASLIMRLDNLMFDGDLYNHYSRRCIEKAEEYHIDNVGKMYKNLCTI